MRHNARPGSLGEVTAARTLFRREGSMRTTKLLAAGLAASSLVSCGEPVSPSDELGPGTEQRALSPTAAKYTVAVVDPINDRFGADFLIDVSRMDLTFDSGTGDY